MLLVSSIDAGRGPSPQASRDTGMIITISWENPRAAEPLARPRAAAFLHQRNGRLSRLGTRIQLARGRVAHRCSHGTSHGYTSQRRQRCQRRRVGEAAFYPVILS